MWGGACPPFILLDKTGERAYTTPMSIIKFTNEILTRGGSVEQTDSQNILRVIVNQNLFLVIGNYGDGIAVQGWTMFTQPFAICQTLDEILVAILAA